MVKAVGVAKVTTGADNNFLGNAITITTICLVFFQSLVASMTVLLAVLAVTGATKTTVSVVVLFVVRHGIMPNNDQLLRINMFFPEGCSLNPMPRNDLVITL